jgi:subtilisin-like proprotein convertase family protein
MVCAVCAVVAVGGEVSADELRATLGEPIEEVAHEVDATVQDGAVTYVVRRTFRNHGARHEEAVLSIKLPPQAAATGLRIRAEDRWYDGELMEANKASELYKELTGMGPHTPRYPALLAWRWADELSLRVFPVPPDGIATVEYTLTAPASYEQGRYKLWYPMTAAAGEAQGVDAASRPLAKVTMRVSPPAGRLVELGGAVYPADKSIPLERVEPHAGCVEALEWLGRDGSCALSELVVPAGAPEAGSVRLRATIKHTWHSDLVVGLRTPDGRWARLFSQEGNKTNDLVLDWELTLPYGTPVSGTWQLLVSDVASQDVGVLSGWSLEVGKQRYVSAKPVVIPDAPGAGSALMAALSVAPGKIDMVAGRLGRVIAAAGKELMRLEVDSRRAAAYVFSHVDVVRFGSSRGGERGAFHHSQIGCGGVRRWGER